MKKRINIEDLRQIRLSLYGSKLSREAKRAKYMQYLSALRKLAYNGNPEAQYDLAQHYDDIGFWGMPNPYHNINNKFYWYTKAANNNHAAANNSLADMYERGEGCTQSIKKALELYKKCASLGDSLGKKNYKLLLKQIKSGMYSIES